MTKAGNKNDKEKTSAILNTVVTKSEKIPTTYRAN